MTSLRDAWKENLEVRLKRCVDLLRLNGPDGQVAQEIMLIFKSGILLFPNELSPRLMGMLNESARRSMGVCQDCDSPVDGTDPLCGACSAKDLAEDFKNNVEFDSEFDVDN